MVHAYEPRGRKTGTARGPHTRDNIRPRSTIRREPQVCQQPRRSAELFAAETFRGGLVKRREFVVSSALGSFALLMGRLPGVAANATVFGRAVTRTSPIARGNYNTPFIRYIA